MLPQISPNINCYNNLKIHSVVYLSPHELRCRFELILRKDGRAGLSKMNIKNNHPVLYYNLVWYCTRLKIPFPLFTNYEDYDKVFYHANKSYNDNKCF